MSAHRLPARPRRTPDVYEYLDSRGLLAAVSDVCSQHGCTVADVVGRSRYARVATARGRVWSLLMNSDPDTSYSELARLFGRDHTTIIHSVRRHEARLMRALSNRSERAA